MMLISMTKSKADFHIAAPAAGAGLLEAESVANLLAQRIKRRSLIVKHLYVLLLIDC